MTEPDPTVLAIRRWLLAQVDASYAQLSADWKDGPMKQRRFEEFLMVVRLLDAFDREFVEGGEQP